MDARVAPLAHSPHIAVAVFLVLLYSIRSRLRSDSFWRPPRHLRRVAALRYGQLLHAHADVALASYTYVCVCVRNRDNDYPGNCRNCYIIDNKCLLFHTFQANPHRKILPQSRSLKYVDARASLFLSLLFVVAIGEPDNKVAAAAASRVTSWLI